MAGIECKPVSENLPMDWREYVCLLKEKNNVFDLIWNNEGIKYKDVFTKQKEKNIQL